MLNYFNLFFIELNFDDNIYFSIDSLTFILFFLYLSVFGKFEVIFKNFDFYLEVFIFFQFLYNVLYFLFFYMNDLFNGFYFYISFFIFISFFLEVILDGLNDYGSFIYSLFFLLVSGFLENSYNLFVIYLFLEIFFLLIISPLFLIYGDNFSCNLVISYFILNGIIGCFFSLGCNIIYSYVFSLDILNIFLFLDIGYSNINFVFFGFLLIIISLFVKLTIVPFHSWGLFIYDHISFGLLSFLFGPVKLIYWYIFLKFFWFYEVLVISSFLFFLSFFLFFFGCLSYFLSIFFMLKECSFGKFFLYSSSIYSGLFLILLSFGDSWIFNLIDLYLFFYICCIYFLFYICEFLNYNIYNISDIIFTDINSNLLFFLVFIYLLSLPPFFSFFFKYYFFFYIFDLFSFFYIINFFVCILIFFNIYISYLYFGLFNWLYLR